MARLCRSARHGADTFAEKSLGTLHALTATDCNWSQFDLGWMYTFFFVLLGVSAATWGGWLERAGPRKAGVRLGAMLVRRPADLARSASTSISCG